MTEPWFEKTKFAYRPITTSGRWVILLMAVGFFTCAFLSYTVEPAWLSDLFFWMAGVVLLVGHYFILTRMDD